MKTRTVPVSPVISSLAESLTLAVDVKIKERVKRGEDIINFGVGQPDFITPRFIREAARDAVEKGATKYTPPGGIPELREAAAAYMRQTGVPATAAGTVVSCGAKHALYNVMAAMLMPGEEILLPVPYWVTYPEQAKLAQAVPVPVTPREGLKVTPADLDAAATPRTRMLLLNSPNNPSGTVYTREETQALVDWCIARDVWILSDEIYDRLVYDSMTAVSPAALGDEAAALTVTVNGVSKAYAMTGWRIGFLHGPPEVVDAVIRFQGQTTGNPAAVSQAAAVAALTGPQDEVESMRVAYERRRNLMLEGMEGIPGVEIPPPHGAFYVFPRVEAAARTAGGSVKLAEKLIDSGIGVVPGAGFGTDDHIRFSFALEDEAVVEGVARFRRGMENI